MICSCGKEFNSQRGLSMHQTKNKCARSNDIPSEDESINEELEKLIRLKNECRDAETKHRYEVMIDSLRVIP